MGRELNLRVATTTRAELSNVTTDLFEESSLLDDIRNCFLLDATSLVDVFEGIEILRLLVLNDPDLRKDEHR